MVRARIVGLGLVLATGLLLWTTTRVSGYELQVLFALLTMSVALAAVVVLFRSSASMRPSNSLGDTASLET